MSDLISDLERLLCGAGPAVAVESLTPRSETAWDLRLPDLRSLPEAAGPWRRLRCCIATEDIAGPVRNGGIGTTYAALAELLAQQGHDSTILYLRGEEVETGDLDEWVEIYAEKGVRFVPVPDYAAREGFRSHADRWMRSPYNMMRYLQDNPMDVVHVSEWRGCGYLSLAAKRQGLGFEDTLFVVKTSSPWMWNRLYGAEPVEKVDDLAKIHAERRSVELADMVVGGSLHLLRWMTSQGYRIPLERTFVQPNVVSFETIRPLVDRRGLVRGTRTPFDEIVFFGRLEGRKGLFVFCQAIARLIRLGWPLPPKITFMGKAGRRLTSRTDLTVLEYIAEETRDWPTEVQVLTDFQQFQALQYLTDGPRLAVMPSVIENSSLAVYEAAICGFPCVASDVGGNTELVDPGDWPQIFCKPHPLSLSEKLAEALEFGGYVPRPSFDNDANLETWRWFHDNLARGLREQLLAAAESQPATQAAPGARRRRTSASGRSDIRSRAHVPAKAAEGRTSKKLTKRAQSRLLAGLWRRDGPDHDDDHFVDTLRRRAAAALEAQPQSPVVHEPASISVCVYAAGADGALRATLDTLAGQTAPPLEVCVAVDADTAGQADEVGFATEDFGDFCRVYAAADLDAGAALNLAARSSEGCLVLFLWEGATLEPDALAVLLEVAKRTDADVLTYMHRSARPENGRDRTTPILNAQLITSASDAFFRSDVWPAPLLVRRAVFEALGGFTEDHRLLGYEAEFIAKAQLQGFRCETVLCELGGGVTPGADWAARRGYDLQASRFRLVRPLLASAPLALRELLLMSKGLQGRAAEAAAVAPKPKRGTRSA